MWHALSQEGATIGRKLTARLMRLADVFDKGKGKSPVITRKPKVVNSHLGLVNNFKTHGSSREAHSREKRNKVKLFER